LGHLFVAAIEWLERNTEPFLLWIHARAFGGAWDAPWEFRQRFADEDDPPPPDFVLPPDKQLPKNFDPDEVLGVTQAYAGQVLLLDACVGTLLEALQDSVFFDETLFVLTSPRGYPLGEHGSIGPCGDSLFSEVLQVPMIIRRPDGVGAGERDQSLVQPGDLYPTLMDWLDLPISAQPDWGRSFGSLAEGGVSRRRDCACSLGDGQRSIRTPAWFYRESDSAPPVLYAKPDDRWEVNEVASRCDEVVEGLSAALDQFQQLALKRQLAGMPALLPLLVESME
jgi:arylsulfatase A-like enzyme